MANSWDLLETISNTDLILGTKQPARARAQLRQMARNLSLIRKSRGEAGGLAALDSDGRIEDEAVIVPRHAYIWRISNFPVTSGDDMEFTTGSEIGLIDSHDLGSAPSVLKVPAAADPAPSLARLNFAFHFQASPSVSFQVRAELRRNGSLYSGSPYAAGGTYAPLGSGERGFAGRSSPIPVGLNTAFTLRVYHSLGSALNMTGSLYMEILE
jgi:hypothetical protein